MLGAMSEPLRPEAAPFPDFPPDFAWGTATASYQIEGSPVADGKGPSVWDTFTHLEGKVLRGQTGDEAADHYRRWESDLDLMAELGVNSYRFSISWPRIVPDGDGAVEPRGLDFYERLVDGLLARGIAPYATLFHWDLPQALEDKGGWLDRGTAEAFGRYAGIVGERLGDRVAGWITLNEPFVHTSYGYSFGTHAPGRFLVLGVWPVVHHLLVGHGLAVRALRAAGVAGGIGITNNTSPVLPVDPASEADHAAAVAMDNLYNRQFWDPVLLGEQPFDPSYYLGSDLTVVLPGDAELIAAPLDFVGVNYYNPQWVKAAGADNPMGFELAPAPAELPTTHFAWPVLAGGLTDLLTGMRDRYGDALPPLYVTENGTSCADAVGADGRVHDAFRIAYLDQHLRAVRTAMAGGVDVRGYFHWTFTDNFEWAEGFEQRFGVVHLDTATQARTKKDSFGWYRRVVTGAAAGVPGTTLADEALA
jgi:beta-glucosidase